MEAAAREKEGSLRLARIRLLLRAQDARFLTHRLFAYLDGHALIRVSLVCRRWWKAARCRHTLQLCLLGGGADGPPGVRGQLWLRLVGLQAPTRACSAQCGGDGGDGGGGTAPSGKGAAALEAARLLSFDGFDNDSEADGAESDEIGDGDPAGAARATAAAGHKRLLDALDEDKAMVMEDRCEPDADRRRVERAALRLGLRRAEESGARVAVAFEQGTLSTDEEEGEEEEDDDYGPEDGDSDEDLAALPQGAKALLRGWSHRRCQSSDASVSGKRCGRPRETDFTYSVITRFSGSRKGCGLFVESVVVSAANASAAMRQLQQSEGSALESTNPLQLAAEELAGDESEQSSLLGFRRWGDGAARLVVTRVLPWQQFVFVASTKRLQVSPRVQPGDVLIGVGGQPCLGLSLGEVGALVERLRGSGGREGGADMVLLTLHRPLRSAGVLGAAGAREVGNPLATDPLDAPVGIMSSYWRRSIAAPAEGAAAGADEAPLERVPGLYGALVGGAGRSRETAALWEEIDLDVARTVERRSDVARRLTRLLRAVAAFFPRLGYCQGLNYVGRFVLQACGGDDEGAFWLMAAALSRFDIAKLYEPGMARVHLCYYQFERLARAHLPRLASHLEALQVTPDLYATSWIITLFTDGSLLPFAGVCRVWDALWVRDGDPSEQWALIFRVILWALHLCSFELLALDDFESCLTFLHRLPFDGQWDAAADFGLLLQPHPVWEGERPLAEQLTLLHAEYDGLLYGRQAAAPDRRPDLRRTEGRRRGGAETRTPVRKGLKTALKGFDNLFVHIRRSSGSTNDGGSPRATPPPPSPGQASSGLRREWSA